MKHPISPLLTDLYQFTMLQGYLDREMHDTAVFELFIRTMPDRRGFFVAAGLESVLNFLGDLRFSEEELKYLAATGRFSRNLIEYLEQMRFTGDLDAMPEGTVFFPNEPVLRIAAPMPQAQLIESRIINLVHMQTIFASKAARCTLAAGGRARLIDFGLRRAHGAEAGIYAARSSYIVGFEGTSTVLAEYGFGIPAFGTMAHSFVEAHDDEKTAFLHFAVSNPQAVTLLIDTYDTVTGAAKVIDLEKTLGERGIAIRGVRLDSGDLLELSRRVRNMFDEAGLRDVQIFASGNIDEYALRELLSAGAPIGGFGVGTKLDTSADVPFFDCAYKLVEYAGRPRHKTSEGKSTWPGRKQVFRQFSGETMVRDFLALEGEQREGTPLLNPWMRSGRRVAPPADLKDIRQYALGQLKGLPAHLRDLAHDPPYPVIVSPPLVRLKAALEKKPG